MKLETAIALRNALTAAIDIAAVSGETEIDLSGTLAAADDTARAELDAAIKAATPGTVFDN
jgi:hypothetical protein